MWRSEDEMLAVVEDRAAGRRRRRQVAGLGSGATVLLVVAVLAAGARTGGPSRPVDVASAGGAVGGGPTTTVATVPGILFPPPEPTSTVAGPPLPPSGFPPPAPPTTTTVPPDGETPPTTAPPAGAETAEKSGLCARDAVAYGVTVSKPAYLSGEQVKATATFRNTGATPCYGPSSLIVQWEDGAGRSIIAIGTHADCFEPRPCGPLLAAGESYTDVECWDQSEANMQVPPGTYGVTFSLDGYRGHAPFEILPDPSGTTTTRPPMAPLGCR